MARSSGSSSSLFSSLLYFGLSITPLFFLSTSEETPFRDVSLENPVIEFVPTPHDGYLCERVHLTGISRINLKHYASSLHVMLKVSNTVPENLHGKAEVCFHRNVSKGLCQCEDDQWKTLQEGQWIAVISPYERRYIDVKVKDKLPNLFTVTADEEFQQWRLICLGFGVLLLLLAPIFSTWVPFYVGSSMAVGILAVVLLLVFQFMKLLPMGRKNILYITLYGSALGIGTYIAQYFSMVVNSILVNFGLSEEMHYPVSVMLLVLIILAGAALGYWIVRKYVISEDGSIDAGIAQFVKWAMRVFGVVTVLQSSPDILLPVIALGIYWCIFFISKKLWRRARSRSQVKHSKNELWQPRGRQASNLWQPRRRQASAAGSRRTEFLSRSPDNDRRTVRRSSSSPYGRSSSSPYGQYNQPMRAIVPTYSSPTQGSTIQQEDYYSTFHKTPKRRFSKAQWDEFTQESTREALAEWASTPEFTKWIADNAHRVQVEPDRNSDDSTESSSNSSDETVVENGSRLSLFNWRH